MELKTVAARCCRHNIYIYFFILWHVSTPISFHLHFCYTLGHNNVVQTNNCANCNIYIAPPAKRLLQTNVSNYSQSLTLLVKFVSLNVKLTENDQIHSLWFYALCKRLDWWLQILLSKLILGIWTTSSTRFYTCFMKAHPLTLASVTLNSLRIYWGMLYSAMGSTTKYWYLADLSAGQYWWHFSWRNTPM